MTMRSPRFIRRHISESNGQGLVEFALILPVLVLLLLGVFDLGRAIYANTAVANTAREGARAAVVRTGSSTVKADILPYISSTAVGIYSTNPSIFSYDVSPSTFSSGDTVIVTVKYTFTAATPFIGQYLGTNGQMVIISQASMIAE